MREFRVSRNEEHLSAVLEKAIKDIGAKYRVGQVEHGGYLPAKPGMLKHMREEALDQIVYTHVLREQLEELHKDMLEAWAADPDADPQLGVFCDRLGLILR